MWLLGYSEAVESILVKLETCSQSYKQFTIIIYESRVVIWGIFKSCMTLESLITIVNCL